MHRRVLTSSAAWRIPIACLPIACGDAMRPSAVPDITGSWSYSESTTREAAASCNIVGSLELIQDAVGSSELMQNPATFVGTFTRTTTCSSPANGVKSTSESGPIPRGKVQDGTIEFRLANCDYRGKMTVPKGLGPARMTGSSLCSGIPAPGSGSAVAVGAWTADRVAEPTKKPTPDSLPPPPPQ